MFVHMWMKYSIIWFETQFGPINYIQGTLTSKRTSTRKLAQVVTFKYSFPLCCLHFQVYGWESTWIRAHIGGKNEYTIGATTQNTWIPLSLKEGCLFVTLKSPKPQCLFPCSWYYSKPSMSGGASSWFHDVSTYGGKVIKCCTMFLL
jgi:hypothetical protein